MRLEKFTKLNFNNKETSRIQQSLEKFFLQLYSNPILKGQAIKSLELTTSAQEIEHALGREPEGFIITDNNASANIYRTTWTKSKITLRASATCTADIWIY